MSDEELMRIAFADKRTVQEILRYIFELGEQKGRADEQKRFIKILADFFGDEPCNYNCMDEFTDNEWCECHCGKSEHTVLECWEHAINSGWLEQLKEQTNG